MASRPSELTATLLDRFDERPPGADMGRWTAFREAYHRAQRLEAVAEFPLQIDFELNSTCQMKCTFCVHGQQKMKKRGLTFAQFQAVIDEGQRFGLCSIKLNYINEPLLNHAFEHYVRYAKNHGVLNVYFATNGLLLDQTRARALIQAGVTKIMVSLDATTAETFQKMRHSPHFERIKANVLGLIRLRDAMGLNFPLVRVNFVKTPVNAHEADAFIEEWRDVADMIGFQDQVAVPGAKQEILRDKELNRFRCSFPYKMIVVDAAGNLLPCCTFSGRQMPLGNIKLMSVKEAWDSLQMRRLRALHAAGDWRSDPVCAGCMGCK